MKNLSGKGEIKMKGKLWTIGIIILLVIVELTCLQLNNISGTATNAGNSLTNTINEGRMTIRNLANKVGNWLKGSPSQAGGKKTRRRRKKRKRKTKHKRKKKKSTRKRKKRTRRRR